MIHEDHDEWCPKLDPEVKARGALSRRSMMGLMGGALGFAVLTGCVGSDSDLSDSSSTTSATGTTTTSSNGTTVVAGVTPEGEIGPYFTDDSDVRYNRSNILSNIDGTNTQAGVPLTLSIYVFDSQNSNAPVAGSQVDIWHCNASGLYSNESVENTLGQTWLRGYQVTDSAGLVTFQTIIPGWYQGRTTHIHLRVRSSYSQASSLSDGTNTTQLFFDQTLVNTLATTVAPYSSEGVNNTTNASDHVYTTETSGQMLMTLTGDDTAGFAATFNIYLPITKEYTTASIWQSLAGLPTTPATAV